MQRSVIAVQLLYSGALVFGFALRSHRGRAEQQHGQRESHSFFPLFPKLLLDSAIACGIIGL